MLVFNIKLLFLLHCSLKTSPICSFNISYDYEDTQLNPVCKLLSTFDTREAIKHRSNNIIM